jgi:hypothetical protein
VYIDEVGRQTHGNSNSAGALAVPVFQHAQELLKGHAADRPTSVPTRTPDSLSKRLDRRVQGYQFLRQFQLGLQDGLNKGHSSKIHQATGGSSDPGSKRHDF